MSIPLDLSALSSSCDLTDKILLQKGPHAISTFSDVYKGILSLQLPHMPAAVQLPVAVKRLRYGDVLDAEFEHKKREAVKEMTVLVCAKHDNILPFLGVYRMNEDVCIVTQWATEGSLLAYLKRTPSADKRALITQVAFGLEYLHNPSGKRPMIVHGNLHPGNVLVTSRGHAVLCDFGLSKLVPDGHSASVTVRPDGMPRGKLAYIAPELHRTDTCRSAACDIFAFAMLMLEVFSGLPPFADRAGGSGSAVIMVLRGERPERPGDARGYTDDLWDITTECWAQNATSRPTVHLVVQRLQNRTGRGLLEACWKRLTGTLRTL